MRKVTCFLWSVGLILLLLQIKQNDGAKILGLFPFHAKSHAIINMALVEELAKRGHELTVISYHPQKPPIPNYEDIVLNTTIDIRRLTGNSSTFSIKKLGILSLIDKIWDHNTIICDEQLQEEAIKELIQSEDRKFDVIITEAFFNECFLGFVHKFKVPLVQICSFGGTHWMGDWLGNPNFYSYVPDQFLNFDDKMTFVQRIINTLMGTFMRLGRRYYYIPKQDAVLRRHFNLKDLPSIAEIEETTSLLLVNNHFSISYPKPLVPNIIQVGGIHVKPPKALPKDLQKYLDDAKDGVIYFSMGSNMKSSEFPEDYKKAFLEAFSSLKQKVLWKWEDDSIPGQPSNLKIEKWFPQQDILAHPNVRVFITHGGLLSSQEAINRGVPLIGIPIMGDQFQNTARAVSKGYGLLLEYENITVESVKWAINEVLDNPKYRESAQRLSRIFRDQPLSPLEQAVFWTEYVIRHKGAKHMRSAALDLTWYQYFLLDVIAVLGIAISIVLLIMYKLTRLVLRKICGSKQPKRKVEKQKKLN